MFSYITVNHLTLSCCFFFCKWCAIIKKKETENSSTVNNQAKAVNYKASDWPLSNHPQQICCDSLAVLRLNYSSILSTQDKLVNKAIDVFLYIKISKHKVSLAFVDNGVYSLSSVGLQILVKSKLCSRSLVHSWTNWFFEMMICNSKERFIIHFKGVYIHCFLCGNHLK